VDTELRRKHALGTITTLHINDMGIKPKRRLNSSQPLPGRPTSKLPPDSGHAESSNSCHSRNLAPKAP
jgi:hypothetical protein